MKYLIKRNVNLFGTINIINFCYDVKINKNQNGFEDFDIGNEEIKIDNLLKKLDDKTIIELNKVNPIYISLSTYFFNNLNKLETIEFENNSSISKISHQDLFNC